MPAILRLLLVVGGIGAAAYGAMWALATYVEPEAREIAVTVPPARFKKEPGR